MELFTKNFNLLFECCKSELTRWASLPLSLIGRVNLIKMTILPQFLYFFQHVPILINKSFFSKLDQLIGLFFWGSKRGITQTALHLPKSKGGLALLNLRYYYFSCNINTLLFWNTCKTSGKNHIRLSLKPQYVFHSGQWFLFSTPNVSQTS